MSLRGKRPNSASQTRVNQILQSQASAQSGPGEQKNQSVRFQRQPAPQDQQPQILVPAQGIVHPGSRDIMATVTKQTEEILRAKAVLRAIRAQYQAANQRVRTLISKMK